MRATSPTPLVVAWRWGMWVAKKTGDAGRQQGAETRQTRWGDGAGMLPRLHCLITGK
jgi:hypothetical protein